MLTTIHTIRLNRPNHNTSVTLGGEAVCVHFVVLFRCMVLFMVRVCCYLVLGLDLGFEFCKFK